MAHSLCRVAKALKGEVTRRAAWQQEQGQWWRLPYTPKYRQVSLALGMGYGQHLWRALLTLRGRKGRIFSGSIPHAFRTVQLASMVWKQLSCRVGMVEVSGCRRLLPRRSLQNWSHSHKSVPQASVIAMGFSTDFCNGLLSAGTGPLKPVSWGCVDYWSCCEMPTKERKLALVMSNKNILHIWIFLQEIKENHVYFLPFAPQGSSIWKEFFGRAKGFDWSLWHHH